MEAWDWLLLERSLTVCFAAISFLAVAVLVSSSSVRSNSLPLGIHPLDAKYFSAEVIKCKDGSKSFTRDRLNDEFCDCLDGTDEPGTSACPAGKFYYCCDGSDEHDGGIICPNTCIMGGVEYKTENYTTATTDLHSTKVKEMKIGINLEDLFQTLAGLKMITVAEVALGCFLVAKWISYKRVKSRRRHHR